jgi:hypothetical protein
VRRTTGGSSFRTGDTHHRGEPERGEDGGEDRHRPEPTTRGGHAHALPLVPIPVMLDRRHPGYRPRAGRVEPGDPGRVATIRPDGRSGRSCALARRSEPVAGSASAVTAWSGRMVRKACARMSAGCRRAVSPPASAGLPRAASRTTNGPPAGGPGVREAGTRGARRRPAGGRSLGGGCRPPGAPSDGASDVGGAPMTVRGGPSLLIQREDGLVCACPCVVRSSGGGGGRPARDGASTGVPRGSPTVLNSCSVTATKHPGHRRDTAARHAPPRRRWASPAGRMRRIPDRLGRGRRTTT